MPPGSENVRSYGWTGIGRMRPKRRDDPKPLSLPDKPSIAVLPFQNMSGDTEQEYFADGIVGGASLLPKPYTLDQLSAAIKKFLKS